MRDDMHVNQWSPFNPEWYPNAFDKHVSTADQLFNTNEIINQGYYIPDPDGSRSSVFRNSAVLNNSFDEKILRNSLADIYLNSSHKLVASNHDQVNFFQWHGRMADMNPLLSRNIAEFSIPVVFNDEPHVIPSGTMFISPKQRDIFKLSQMYQRWIKVEDICNNWNIFQWHLMIFINQRVMSEYELYIDEQEILIRFPFIPRWQRDNHLVSVYKFETNFSRRTLISRELLMNRWNWKVPLEWIRDPMIRTQSKLMIAFNHISDPNIRRDGRDGINVLGDNLEFININHEEGIIDLSSISKFNHILLRSDADWMWMTILVPKFFHEFPILLPTDIVHRPYIGALRPVMTVRGMVPQRVKAELVDEETLQEENVRQVYIDMHGDNARDDHYGWLDIIRPIVLSDAFEDPMREPMIELVDEIRALRDTTKPVADVLKYFKFYYGSKTQAGNQVLEIDQTPFIFSHNTQISATEFYVVDLPEFRKIRGATIRIRFQHPLLIWNPKLNVNDTGHHPLNLHNHTIGQGSIATIGWNGTSWDVLDVVQSPSHDFEGGYGFLRGQDGKIVYMTDEDGEFILDDTHVERRFIMQVEDWDDVLEYYGNDLYDIIGIGQDHGYDKYEVIELVKEFIRSGCLCQSGTHYIEFDGYQIHFEQVGFSIEFFINRMIPSRQKIPVLIFIPHAPPINNDLTPENWVAWIDHITKRIQELQDAQHAFFDRRKAIRDSHMDSKFDLVYEVLEGLKGAIAQDIDGNWHVQRVLEQVVDDEGNPVWQTDEDDNIIYDACGDPIPQMRLVNSYADWLFPRRDDNETFWDITSYLIIHTQHMVERFRIVEILRGLRRRHLWGDPRDLKGLIRFQRPIEEHNFWMFEYDVDNEVWRPVERKISRHFPDVYIVQPPGGGAPEPHKVFKAFFFYSDTMNVLEKTREIERPTPTWDEDVLEYHHDRRAIYRDVFMEKFYWMGIRAIYKGMLMTQQRWEVIEYIFENPVYARFNELFLKTMDPYFKLGLATYLKSDHFEFPFDDAVAKMEEAITLEWNDFKKVTNFEVYLNNHWIPSFFDHITRIMDDWNPVTNGQVRFRPPSTFDMRRLLPILLEVQEYIIGTTSEVLDKLDWVLQMLKIEHYNLNIPLLNTLRNSINNMLGNMETVLRFINNLDLYTYSIDDVLHIIEGLEKHLGLVDGVYNSIKEAHIDVDLNNIWETKRANVKNIREIVESFSVEIDKILNIVYGFDMDGFMNFVNDMSTMFYPRGINPNDTSLMGNINKFEELWNMEVQDARDELWISTAMFQQRFDPRKSYSEAEIREFMDTVLRVQNALFTVRRCLMTYWRRGSLEHNDKVLTMLDHSDYLIANFNNSLQEYYFLRNDLNAKMQQVRDLFDLFDSSRFSDLERSFMDNTFIFMDGIMRALSFIAGENRRDEAEANQEAIFGELDKWLDFIEVEESVFVVLVVIVEYPDNDLIHTVEDHRSIINAMIDYMRIVEERFVPDAGWPTFSHVFAIQEISLQYDINDNPINRGFRYEVDDLVFFPRLGTYRVTETTGDVFKVVSIDDTGWRNTNFRNPVIQTRGYGSISNGRGAGLIIRAIRSDTIYIINDTVIRSTVLRIRTLVNTVHDFCRRINPHNNSELNILISTIPIITREWEQLVDVFGDHITDEIKTTTTGLVTSVQDLIPLSEEFIEVRSTLDVRGFLALFNELLRQTWRAGSFTNWETPQLAIRHDQGTVLYSSWMNFFGRGTNWRDQDRLEELLNESNTLLGTWIVPPGSPNQEEIQDVLDQCRSKVTTLIGAIPLILSFIPRFDTINNNILNTIDSIAFDDLREDHWYRIYRAVPAVRGTGYKIGDIIQIVYDDIPDDDVILLQVTEASDGEVMALRPFMDYALPYKLWGVMDTITMTGEGDGLGVDVFSRLIGLEDSTLLNPNINYGRQTDRLQENDLVMFEFENIHDLNINYEVFLGGRQITHFIQRHEHRPDYLHPTKVDVVYLNANEVWNLRNSSIFVAAKRYFVYRIDAIEIIDPGAGYHTGQDLFVDTAVGVMRLKVAKLVYEPYKGIEELIPMTGQIRFVGQNPAGEGREIVPDAMNNIDDEFNVGYYDRIPAEGIDMPATLSPETQHIRFLRTRWDDMDGDPRNDIFMYPSIGMVHVTPCVERGDPDYHWYQGSRLDNSFTGDVSDRWNGLMNLNPPTNTFMHDSVRVPLEQPLKGEYQEFKRILLHNSEELVTGNMTVNTYADLPRHSYAWPDGGVGKTVIVENDETNRGHRMIYRVRTMTAGGWYVYDWPMLADQSWNSIDIDWMNIDWHPMYPNLRHQYPQAPWRTSPTHEIIRGRIEDGIYQPETDYIGDPVNNTAYIHQVTIPDLSCFNWTTFQWEDLTDTNRWELEMREDPDNQDWGFKLTLKESGYYAYDMKFYLNKIPDTQTRNAELKRNAVIDIVTSLIDEIYIPAINSPVNTGRGLRIRKLFPYEQQETFVLGREKDERYGQTMEFKLAPYIHFKNQLQLQDIRIRCLETDEMFNIIDSDDFEVRFKDPRAATNTLLDGSLPTEIRTHLVPFDDCNNISIITFAGDGFFTGPVWAWNPDFQIHVFGRVVINIRDEDGRLCPRGFITDFIPTHCPNPPMLEMGEDKILQFQVYQRDVQSLRHAAIVLLRFKTEEVEVCNEGYIKNVNNPYAPLPDEFQIIYNRTLQEKYNFEVSIPKTARRWDFMEPEWLLTPTFNIPEFVRQDQLYLLVDQGRFPLINPSTGLPSFLIEHDPDKTLFTFLSLYRRSEHIQVRSLPYSQRSVYVQRRIPSHGYINLEGKINKPLNKKYFEFWVNGKLLDDEVTIITPSKIFLHGLTSLRNLEIIEVNRDPNEFFSDSFLGMSRVTRDGRNRPVKYWNWRTYLDGALEGNLEGDNYTLEEQAYLISPVWPQVGPNHPSFKDFPPNVDNDTDILIRIHAPEDFPIVGIDNTTFQFLLVDGPTLEGVPMLSGGATWQQFGWLPISNERILELFREEWWEEIENGIIDTPSVISDDDWFGTTTRLYNEYGIRVHNLNEAAYSVHDYNILQINTERNTANIIRNQPSYDLD